MSRIIQCTCGKKLKVVVPPGGATAKCPGCGTTLRIKPSGDAPGTLAPPTSSAPRAAAPAARRAQPAAAADDPFGVVDATLGTPSTQSDWPTANAASSTSFQPPAGGGFAAPAARKSPASANKKNQSLIVAGVGVLAFLLAGLGAYAVVSKIQHKNRLRKFIASKEAERQEKVELVTSQPVTPAEAKGLAEEFERELNGPSQGISAQRLIRYDLLVSESIEDFDLDTTAQKQFISGATSQMKRDNFGLQLARLAPGGIKLLRMRTAAGKPTALFRVSPKGGGVTYFELGFGRTPESTVCINNVYLFSAGEWMTETLHRRAVPMVASMNRSFLERLSGKDKDLVEHAASFRRVSELSQVSPRAALAEYKKLPPSLQRDKVLLITRIGMASKLNDEAEYEAAITDYRKHYPDDAAQMLFAIDYYFLKGDTSGSLDAIHKLDKSVGGDPALHVLEANLHVTQGNLEKAKAALQQAIEMDPEYEEAKRLLASI